MLQRTCRSVYIGRVGPARHSPCAPGLVSSRRPRFGYEGVGYAQVVTLALMCLLCVHVCVLCTFAAAVAASTHWVATAEHHAADCVARGLTSTTSLPCRSAVVAALPFVPRPPPIPRPALPLSRALPATPTVPLPLPGAAAAAAAVATVTARDDRERVCI